jgi:hypothetical protein
LINFVFQDLYSVVLREALFKEKAFGYLIFIRVVAGFDGTIS